VAHLIVRDGSLRGRRFEVESGEITIGRERTDILVADDGEVSRNHAIVRESNDGVEVEDLGSTNGTFVNELRISEPTRLSSGDIVRVGQTRFDVELTEDPNKTVVSGMVAPPTQEHSAPIPQMPAPGPPPAESGELPDRPAEPSHADAPEPHVDELPLPSSKRVEEPEAAPDPAMREETSELPGRMKVGEGDIQRAPSSKRALLVVAGLALSGVIAIAIYMLVADGPPTRADYVNSVNDVCRDRMPRTGALSGDRARETERAASMISEVTVQIEELERPEARNREIDRFMSTLEQVGSGLEDLNVSQRANNNRRAQEADRKLQRFVKRFENASRNLGTRQCSFER
jgi:pSer/pThr/pTyr-binding forkhead associated (FHA) protein/plasmid stabilization system protein ParE